MSTKEITARHLIFDPKYQVRDFLKHFFFWVEVILYNMKFIIVTILKCKT